MAETREFDACKSVNGKPTKETVTLRTFDTWQQVLDHVSERGHIYYKGGLQYKPEFVWAKVIGNTVRTKPSADQADPWTMDSSYLNLCWEKVG